MTDHFLVVGLGNPGRQYRYNRHNVGFMLLDRLAAKHKVTFAKKQNDALVTSARLDGIHLILAKPQTYMNLSGRSVSGLLNFYKLPLARLLVCFDDLDLPQGRIRIRPEGGSAGQNGMKSIIEQLGTQAFPRLRIGIGRPPGRMDPAGYVLQDFRDDEIEVMNATLDRCVEAVECIVLEGLAAAMNRYNAPGDADT